MAERVRAPAVPSTPHFVCSELIICGQSRLLVVFKQQIAQPHSLICRTPREGFNPRQDQQPWGPSREFSPALTWEHAPTIDGFGSDTVCLAGEPYQKEQYRCSLVLWKQRFLSHKEEDQRDCILDITSAFPKVQMLFRSVIQCLSIVVFFIYFAFFF